MDTTHECFVSRAIELLYNRQVNALDKEAIAKLGKSSLDGMGARDILIELLSNTAPLSQRIDKN